MWMYVVYVIATGQPIADPPRQMPSHKACLYAVQNLAANAGLSKIYRAECVLDPSQKP